MPEGRGVRQWLPLSPAQRMVWMDLRLNADPLAYQLAVRCRVEGALDLPTLRQSLTLLAARHDALRLRIDPESPRQWLAEAPEVPFVVHDAAAADELPIEQHVAAVLADVIPLADAPMLQLDLWRGRGKGSELVWRISHLLVDLAGMQLMLQQWVAIYNALIDETPGTLPPGSSFVDTLAADEAHARTPASQADLAHWVQRFGSVPEPVFERQSTPGAPAHEPLRWSLAGTDYTRWRSACTQTGVTDQRLMLALLALAIGTRYDRRDFTIALALHGRDAGTRSVVGMLAGALPVRCRWPMDATLKQVVQRLSAQLDDDYRHQRTPVADISRALGLATRGLTRLFDISLSFVQADEGAAALTLGGATLNPQPLPTRTIVPLPLLVTHRPQAQALDFELTWDEAYFGTGEAASLADGLRRVIAQFCARPSLPVAELEPASDAERALVLERFNPPATLFAHAATLHEQVRAQVRATPDAPAVIDGDVQLSYAELHAQSDALARRLRAALPADAVEPVVGVALPRSAGTVVALLAILKAQAVYLPLDIAHPLQRLQTLLDDAQAALLIDQAGGTTAALTTPRLGADAAGVELPPDTAAERAQRLAYVIYTSGSTGSPKPVGVSHRAAVNLAQARQGHDPIGPGSRVLAAISVGFDVSIGQLLLPLLSGAAIVVAPPLRDLDAAGFWALLARHGVTHINSVPSFFDTVSEALHSLPEPQRYRGLQRLMLGGEALTGALARKLQQRLPGTQIVNMYGPTEACIDATAFVVPDEGELPVALPIGRPLANYRAVVVDGLGRLLPPGVAGELCLGGAGLARGYLRRPGATAEKFVPDAFSAIPGERLYRTGDRARWSADGLLEFLGRHDQQVKIRGFRVETGEVEATLLAHPAVQQAAVIAPKDAAGHTRLLAYVVAPGGTAAPDAAVLKQWLAERLPDHMVPAAIVSLAALPLTANGKLDQRALPLPEAQALGQRAFVPPQGEIEITLAAVWAELLQQPPSRPIGRHDSFFELGGHSLLAITLVDRMRRLSLEVDVTAVFAQPTLEALARATRSAVAAVETNPVPPCGIPAHADRITPEMLPMLALSQAHIDRVVGAVGSASQVQDIYPLAPLQQGLLFHHLLQGEGDPYLTPMVLGFDTRAALDGFVQALQQVVVRHDVLRTSFLWEGLPQPVQVVWRSAPLVLEVQAADAADALGAITAKLDARRHRLGLTRAPLLRALGVHDVANGGRWLLGLSLHHLVLDQVSVGLVMQEVAAIQRGELALLPPPRPFRAAVWRALHDDTAAAEAVFRARLGDVDTPTAPYGLADVRAGAAGVREARLELPADLAAAARATARAAGVTLASLLHLAWALVVARTSGRDDVVFGTVLFGRMKPASQDALGLFINTLPLRLDVGAAPVSGALQSAHERLLELLQHEHAPLALAQRCSGVTAPAPLFSALLNVRMQAAPAESAARLLWSQQLTGYPVAMAVDDDGAALALHVQSIPPADPSRVARLMRSAVEQLVQALQHAPERNCAALDLIDADERELLLGQFNPPALAVPRERTLHELVREQAARTPDALAVVDGAVQLSYRELDVRSDALARQIRAAVPATDEPVVGVALPRSAATVVALLAILKAQAVYLPLDIAYPARRLQYLLDDAQAALLIDEPGGATAGLVAPRLPADAPTTELPREAHADRAQRLAYVIYTSGSTGQPKPVGVSHGAAINLAWARQHGHDPIDGGSRVLAAISVGFDVSIGQLLLPLLHGAAIVVAPPLRTLQASDFWALLREQAVTHINSVPSFFETVSDALPPQGHTGLQRLMLGGEALTAATVRKLQQRLPGTQIINIYGPTEASVDATAFELPRTADLLDAIETAIPIGRPLANYRAYVLDPQGRLAPLGVSGELCIAGAGLARGYLNRPEATAEKFVVDPFSTQPGERLYRTGDQARWRPDGTLEFLGRNDEQVKVRGFRVETGEIEATLLQHPSVKQAAVIARKDRAGHTQLLGYLVAEGEQAETGTVRSWLAERLPEHMVPATLTWLNALPLTTNGKLDRQALPTPDVSVQGSAANEPPQGEAELAVAAAWSAVLGIGAVNRDDDFFALGGQSLLAISLVERLRQVGWRLDVPTLFAKPTLRAMAAACRAVDGAEAPAVAVPPPGIPVDAMQVTPAMLPMVALTAAQIDSIVAAVPSGAAMVQDIYPLAPLQQGMLYHHLMQPVGDVYLTPLITAFAQRETMDRFVDALQQVIARHDILRTSIAWSGLPEPVQVVWRRAPLTVEVLAPAGDTEALALLKAAVDSRVHRIDLQRAPLLRAVATPDAPNGRWLLALCLHHLALDHTSMDIVMQEIAAIGQGAALPPPVPFRNLVWLARQGVGEAEHQAFFSAMLGDVDTPTAPYGLAEVRGDAQGVQDAWLDLPAGLAAAVRREARAAGASAASFMHLAWALVLARTSGRDDVVFGTVLFGRLNAAAGADRALGMLINTLPLRVPLGGVNAGDALAATHQRLVGLMRHEHAPLALAQRCSGVAAPAPLFTALFNHRHAAPASSASPAFELVWGEERTGYPLSLAVDDDGQGFRLHVQSVSPADPSRVARLMRSAVEQLVQALQHAPETNCAALDLIDADERALLLTRFNPPALAVPRERTLHELVSEQVARSPDALAVIDGAAQLSYRELDVRSDALARQIRAAVPATDEPVVGVALPRSAATVVALLAILKAQAVYLPLDIAYPAQRLQYLLDDAQAALLLDEPGGLTADLVAPRLPADASTAELPSEAHADRAQRLAYVIYTSGSTGQPKPVGVSHAAAINLAWARQHGHDPIGAGSRVLAAISVGFDVSIGQLLLPLLHGAAIVIAPPLRTLQASDFWALLREQQVTHINSVPSFFETVSDALPPEGHTGLQRLMLGGEALTAATVRKLQQRLPGTQVVNMYGPTEACIDATAFVLPEEGDLPSAIPIGRPLANYRTYVLDPQGRLAPLGVSGELCIAGAGLARGYLNRPEATAEKFVPDAFSSTPGERLYRTGDQARWRPDGTLEFLGRNDEQVKVRGFRVETGEIEATLLQQPSVKQAAVIARKDRAGHTQLLGYLVADGAQAETSTVRTWLAERLPEHMVPAALAWLPALPLTTNGKLDRQALPGIDTAAAVAPYAAPRNAIELALQDAWQTVFAHAPIGIDDDFFSLGGHSLLALRLVHACQSALRGLGEADAAERIVLRQLLAQPTIAGMAQSLRAPVLLRPQGLRVALRPGEGHAPVFCVHPQSGTVWCFAELARHLTAGVPVIGLQAPGLEAGETPLDTVGAMAHAAITAMREVQPRGPYRLIGYSSGGVTAYEMAQQLRAAGESVSVLVLLDSPVPDGADTREPTEAETLADAGRLLGIAEPAQWPRHAAELAALMRGAGLADATFGEREAQRLVDTSRGIVGAVRRHAALPSAQPLLQIRALVRDTPPSDWRRLGGSGLVTTHDLAADHVGLIGPVWAKAVADLINPHLLAAP